MKKEHTHWLPLPERLTESVERWICCWKWDLWAMLSFEDNHTGRTRRNLREHVPNLPLEGAAWVEPAMSPKPLLLGPSQHKEELYPSPSSDSLARTAELPEGPGFSRMLSVFESSNPALTSSAGEELGAGDAGQELSAKHVPGTPRFLLTCPLKRPLPLGPHFLRRLHRRVSFPRLCGLFPDHVPLGLRWSLETLASGSSCRSCSHPCACAAAH